VSLKPGQFNYGEESQTTSQHRAINNQLSQKGAVAEYGSWGLDYWRMHQHLVRADYYSVKLRISYDFSTAKMYFAELDGAWRNVRPLYTRSEAITLYDAWFDGWERWFLINRLKGCDKFRPTMFLDFLKMHRNLLVLKQEANMSVPVRGGGEEDRMGHGAKINVRDYLKFKKQRGEDKKK
jgi:hypothetical protein